MTKDDAYQVIARTAIKIDRFVGVDLFPTKHDRFVSYALGVRVVFSRRLRSTLAVAFYDEATIEVNAKWWERAPRLERYQTIEHETAHLACDHLFLGSARLPHHGATWQRVMHLIRATPD